ncbi:MAG: 1-acyl-sn-glycerol-3-phosphate acyltransferase [Betaproteobacteria bacterium]|nr:1-acyl-sn-glycerol-3-phosphate acyltransferase [Betaproteobacteria bacterium]
MAETIQVPAWLFIVVAGLAIWAILEHLILPGLRFVASSSAEKLVEDVSARLHIAIRPWQRTRRRVLIERLLYDHKLQDVIAAHAKANKLPREVSSAIVERYVREIVPAFNAYLYFRIGYWLSRRVAQTLYRVRLGYVDAQGLAAIDPNATVVFVMNHRSNMDYVLAGYLAADQAALSYAVGEWARIWPLSHLIRSMGAYFVRRNSKDELYRKVLERYITMATVAGVPQAVFPEGGLTRDGRMREPRLGVLDYMLRGFRADGERDVVFIPLGINYDRVLEDRTLLRSVDPQAGRVGRARALGNTIAFVGRNLRLMLKSRWYRFGYACVNFGSPVSMRAYCRERGFDFPRLTNEERRARMAEFGAHLMNAVGGVVPVLPVPLMAAVFVRNPGRALAGLEIKAQVERLLARLDAGGAHVYVPRRDLDYALDAGLRMLTLRHLVDENDGLYTARAAETALLAYYANSIEHLLRD